MHWRSKVQFLWGGLPSRHMICRKPSCAIGSDFMTGYWVDTEPSRREENFLTMQVSKLPANRCWSLAAKFHVRFLGGKYWILFDSIPKSSSFIILHISSNLAWWCLPVPVHTYSMMTDTSTGYQKKVLLLSLPAVIMKKRPQYWYACM